MLFDSASLSSVAPPPGGNYQAGSEEDQHHQDRFETGPWIEIVHCFHVSFLQGNKDPAAYSFPVPIGTAASVLCIVPTS